MNVKIIRKNARKFCGCPNAGISCEKDCKDSFCAMRERYDGYVAGHEACHARLRRFASRVFSILGVKALNGCADAKWEGFCNGNGTEVGRDIDALTITAKNLSK